MNKLPDKPSELIRVALVDLRKCEADKRYRIDMNQWHVPVHTTQVEENVDEHACFVCLSGAVMGQTLEVPLDYYANRTSSKFDRDTQCKLGAINFLRMGNLTDAFILLHINLDGTGLPRRPIEVAEYINDSDRFYADMERLAVMLERVGL